jgi:imidazoleglycerol-phosphate dehydratase
MLESFTKHSLIDLDIKCNGDIDVDFHHTVEDIGIVIGQALKKELYPIKEVERFGNSIIVMDESAIECAIDLSNRPFLVFESPLKDGKVGEFDVELVEEFFRAIVLNASITTHLIFQRGKNKHHIIEAMFKAFAVALRRSINKNERVNIPSTKGIL